MEIYYVPLDLTCTFKLDTIQPGGHLHFLVPRNHVTTGNITPLLKHLEILAKDPYRFRNCVSITFSGWQNDTREVVEIPEIISYYKKLDGIFPYLPIFLSKWEINGHHAFNTYAVIVSNSRVEIREKETFDVAVNRKLLGVLIIERINAIGDLLIKLNVSNEEGKEIFDSITVAMNAI